MYVRACARDVQVKNMDVIEFSSTNTVVCQRIEKNLCRVKSGSKKFTLEFKTTKVRTIKTEVWGEDLTCEIRMKCVCV